MTRKRALEAIYGAGTQGDKAALMRLYVEHRVSYRVAMSEFLRGVRFAAWVAARDATARALNGPA